MFRVAERADADPMEDPILLNVRIVDDLTIFSAPEQTELLELYGEFWNPKNLQGTYDRISIAQLTQSPWRSIGKIPRAKKILKDLYDPTLAYPEVVMGHRLFSKLQAKGYKPKKIKTLKQLMKIVESFAGCEDALTP